MPPEWPHPVVEIINCYQENIRASADCQHRNGQTQGQNDGKLGDSHCRAKASPASGKPIITRRYRLLTGRDLVQRAERSQRQLAASGVEASVLALAA